MGRGKKVMSDRGGKGKVGPTPCGSGREGLRRRMHKMMEGSAALNKPSLRRLARRAGVKRMNAGIYDEAPAALRSWLSKMLRDASIYMESARRKTVVLNDVLLALKRNGQ